jgi:hypothetical protein
MYRTKKGLLLAEIESVYGTDPTPTTAANVIAAVGGEVNWSPNFERLSRMIADGTTSKVSGYNVQPTVTLNFACELRGNRTTGATDTDITSGAIAQAVEIDPLLRACDLLATYTAETTNGARDGYVTYTPTTPDNEGASVTFYFYHAGKLHKVTGAKGDARITFEAGRVARIDFTFQGIWNTPTDAALPGSITWLDTKPPLFRSATATLAAWAGVMRTITLELGNNIVRRDDGNSTTGVRGFVITGRNPRFSIDLESVLEATHPVFGDLYASTSRTLAATLGATAGNKVAVTLVGESVAAPYGDANEIRTNQIEYEVCREDLSDTPNSELAIKFF